MMTKSKTAKRFFVDGAISAKFIANSIERHQTNTNIGAYDIFLGQVRNDQIEGKEVTAIEFTAYKEMAEKELERIKKEALKNFDLVCAHIHHSLGKVKAGEICLYAIASAAHREAAFQACQFIVEKIKSEVPVFGKEILADKGHQWKINK